MNRQHLRTILWLRWRMSLNQLRRGGVASRVILALLGIVIVASSLGTFLVSLLVGIFLLPRASPEAIMYVWDGVVVAFVFFWLVGLMAELQRSEVLSLQKLLHMPISLSGTFVINYLGSLFSLSMVIFLPAMLGLTIAGVVAQGPRMLLVFPLLASCLLMVTAITYQFQGWLASLMVNKRRRRTVIACVTLGFVLLSQLPNLLNAVFHSRRADDNVSEQFRADRAALERQRDSGAIDRAEYAKRQLELRNAEAARRNELRREGLARVEQMVLRLNVFVPLGWLPYGARACARAEWLPALLAMTGAALIGSASLWRSYRTTLRLYTGHFTSGRKRKRSAAAPAVSIGAPNGAGLMERRLPVLSEPAAAIALANFRSLTRAPEARMLLLAPAIMVVVFSSMMLMRQVNLPDVARPFVGFGAVSMVLLSLMQLMGNVFGLDRDGFRALVMSPSPRRDILLGKNVSIAPIAVTMGTVILAFLQVIYPMRFSHLIATGAELMLTFLILCLVGNMTSVLAPMPVASGSLKPANPKVTTVLVQMFFVIILFPVVLGLALLPLALELLLHHFGILRSVPLYMIASTMELFVLAVFYRMAIRWQGDLLHAREQRILSIVTTKVE